MNKGFLLGLIIGLLFLAERVASEIGIDLPVISILVPFFCGIPYLIYFLLLGGGHHDFTVFLLLFGPMVALMPAFFCAMLWRRVQKIESRKKAGLLIFLGIILYLVVNFFAFFLAYAIALGGD